MKAYEAIDVLEEALVAWPPITPSATFIPMTYGTICAEIMRPAFIGTPSATCRAGKQLWDDRLPMTVGSVSVNMEEMIEEMVESSTWNWSGESASDFDQWHADWELERRIRPLLDQ